MTQLTRCGTSTMESVYRINWGRMLQALRFGINMVEIKDEINCLSKKVTKYFLFFSPSDIQLDHSPTLYQYHYIFIQLH